MATTLGYLASLLNISPSKLRGVKDKQALADLLDKPLEFFRSQINPGTGQLDFSPEVYTPNPRG